MEAAPALCSPDGAGRLPGSALQRPRAHSPQTRETAPLTSLQPRPPSFFRWPPAPSACGDTGCQEHSEPHLPFFGTGRGTGDGGSPGTRRTLGAPTRGWAAMLHGWTRPPGLCSPWPPCGLKSQTCSCSPPTCVRRSLLPPLARSPGLVPRGPPTPAVLSPLAAPRAGSVRGRNPGLPRASCQPGLCTHAPMGPPAQLTRSSSGRRLQATHCGGTCGPLHFPVAHVVTMSACLPTGPGVPAPYSSPWRVCIDLH